jgi:hypothetical protein
MFLSVSLPVREFSPQLSVEVVAGKRLRVTTRCVRPAMLGPASAGVGVSRNGTFSLNGGQLAREPEEQERGGMMECVLEFDMIDTPNIQIHHRFRFTVGRFAEDGDGPLVELPLPFANLVRTRFKTL